MTREEKIKILDYAIERAYREVDAATGAEMDTVEFHTLLDSLSEMEWMLERFQTGNEHETIVVERPADPAPVAVDPVTPEPPAPTQTADPAYKMEDVRAALAKARGKGVNVSEIIRSFGAENFQQITPDQYPAVMAKLEGAGA